MLFPQQVIITMGYIEFVEIYCEKYNLELIKEKRLKGAKLLKVQLLAYILYLQYNISFQSVADIIKTSRQSAMHAYYLILGNDIYRKIAEERYKEITKDVRNVQTN